MDTKQQRLRSLLANARIELKKQGRLRDAHRELVLTEIESLERLLDANKASDKELKAAEDALTEELRPTNAGAPAGEGLQETRRLWEELNHIVQSR